MVISLLQITAESVGKQILKLDRYFIIITIFIPELDIFNRIEWKIYDWLKWSDIYINMLIYADICSIIY